MKCPVCHSEDLKVIDSRPVEESNGIRRRRECGVCRYRFTTYEMIDTLSPIVIKKNGTRELYDTNKLRSGLVKACEKRPVNAKEVCDEIEAALQATMKKEITSTLIGEMVMERLRKLDEVAYVRYASVHREFKDIDSFAREISELKNSGNKAE